MALQPVSRVVRAVEADLRRRAAGGTGFAPAAAAPPIQCGCAVIPAHFPNGGNGQRRIKDLAEGGQS